MNQLNSKKVLFFAHRGGGKGVFENRLETIKKSLKNNFFDGIEVDVRRTRDGVLVLHHNRGINIQGKFRWIDQVNYREIKHLGIPTLEEVILLFKKNGIDKILNIDLKEKNIDKEVVFLLKKYDYRKKIYFDCFHLETLFRIQEEIENGSYFLSSSLEDSRDISEKRLIKILLILLSILFSRLAIFFLKKKVKKVKLDGISIYYRFMNKDLIKDLKDFGFKVFAWGTDKSSEIKKLMKIGIDGIKTSKIIA